MMSNKRGLRTILNILSVIIFPPFLMMIIFTGFFIYLLAAH